MRAVLLMLLGALVLTVAGCPGAPEVRYRVTIEVDDNGTIRSGSSVWSWQLSKGGLTSPYNGKFKGEAIAVDLPGRPTLFGLLVGRSEQGGPETGAMEMLPERVFGDTGRAMRGEKRRHRDRFADIEALRERVGETVQIDCPEAGPKANLCPLFVIFRNVDDPKTIEAVNPEHLGASLGSGVKLKHVIVEITDDPVTAGNTNRLSWIGKYPEPSLNPHHGPHDYSLSAILHHGALRQGGAQ